VSIEGESARLANETFGKVARDIYGDVARPAARQIGTALETSSTVLPSSTRESPLVVAATAENDPHWLRPMTHMPLLS
jgi:hypothetical protein